MPLVFLDFLGDAFVAEDAATFFDLIIDLTFVMEKSGLEKTEFWNVLTYFITK